MNSFLARTAVVGLGVGIVSLSLAWALGGREDIRRVIAAERFGWHSCDDTLAVAGPERRLPWTGGDKIEVTTPVPLRVTARDGGDVVLRGTPAAVSHLQLRGGRLFSCGRLEGPVEVELPARALRHVHISGTGNVTLEKLDQRELELRISGSGQIEAHGSVERVAAHISGSGDVRLGDLAMQRLTTKISGSGSVEAGPKEEADVTLSGAGRVTLLTRPASLHSKVSGSGRITQPPLEAAQGKK